MWNCQCRSCHVCKVFQVATYWSFRQVQCAVRVLLSMSPVTVVACSAICVRMFCHLCTHLTAVLSSQSTVHVVSIAVVRTTYRICFTLQTYCWYPYDTGVNPSENLGMSSFSSHPLISSVPLPYPHFLSPFPSLFLSSFPGAHPLSQLGGLGSAVSSLVGSGAKPQPTNDLVHIWAKRSSQIFVDTTGPTRGVRTPWTPMDWHLCPTVEVV